MTLVTTVLSKAARRVSVSPPSNWLTATSASAVELRDDFLPETVEELHRRVDWPEPIGKSTTLIGDGSETYSLPTDFWRITTDPFSVYETANTRRIATPVNTIGEWTHLKTVGTGGGERFYRLGGFYGARNISLYPFLGTGETVSIAYVSDRWMADSGGDPGAEFTAATDVVLFPERLLVAGIVARFRERKGLDFESERTNFEMQLGTLANQNIRRVDMGTSRQSHPFDIPVPDYIPSS